ncbi:MAG: hypothetical protein II937_04450 [Bacteroidales bacterium]|nr:hypothetical protein [Bacteroidales bacterium]
MKLFKIIIKIYAIIFVLVQFFLLYYIFFKPSREPQPSSNKRIIEAYSEGVRKDSLFLNQVAEAFIETNYKGVIKYCCFTSGRRHTLSSFDSDLTDIYPKIREVIKKKFPDARDTRYEYIYNDGILFLDVLSFCLYNYKMELVILLYTDDLEKLKQRFSNYKFYDTNNIPIETYGWIYRISKNWYICSPDDNLYFQKFNDFSKTINANKN